ncbi:MAG: FAD-dependent oxidoreductase [Chloroflexota bacterium]|nr:FAD-dependent oxidoreductase [Chloroflexota bacterium]
MASEFSTDVLVIGGGPAGSAAATMLARQGWQVLLLERELFPREHVGESLLPASIPILEELGVLPAVEAQGFVKKLGATMVWGREREPWSWFFGETNRRNPHSYQVWRPTFDHLLLDNAAANGVEVRQGWRATEILLAPQSSHSLERPQSEGAVSQQSPGADASAPVVRCLDHNGLQRLIPARFVVDASGQNGLLGRQLDLRQWDESFRNLAVYAYYQGAERLPPPADTNIFIESYAHGWLWTIPLHTGQASVGAVVDQQIGEEQVRELGLERFLTDQLAEAPHTAGMLRNAQKVSGPFVVKDWSYACDNIAGDGYVLAGDAACFIDPLFSSGVHLALMSGVLAAAYATTALRNPEMGPAAAQVYAELYMKEYHHFREMVRLFYSSNRTVDSYFWEARRILEGQDGADSGLSPRASFIQAVAGQPPRGYERMVLERGAAPAAFAENVRAVEEDRIRRQSEIQGLLEPRNGQPPRILDSAPRLGPGVRVERKPVPGDGVFEWGYVLVTDGHPEGLPCSNLVARLATMVDGQTTVRQILTALASEAEPAQQEQLLGSVVTALQILYVDGTIAGL